MLVALGVFCLGLIGLFAFAKFICVVLIACFLWVIAYVIVCRCFRDGYLVWVCCGVYFYVDIFDFMFWVITLVYICVCCFLWSEPWLWISM